MPACKSCSKPLLACASDHAVLIDGTKVHQGSLSPVCSTFTAN